MENQIVILQNSTLVTSSLLVAEKFGKRHDNVIQIIEKKLQNPDIQNRLIFKAVEYIDKKGERRKMYTMTRDGFSLLVMGFTGREAEKFQLEFLDAFNRMEEYIRNRTEKAEITGTEFFLDKMLKPVKKATFFGKKYLNFYDLNRFVGRKYSRLPITLRLIFDTPGQTSIIPVGPHEAFYLDDYATRTFLRVCQTPKAKQLLSMIQPSKQLAS